MNITRLRGIVELLLSQNQRHKIDRYLGEVESHINNLAGNPQNPGFQTELSAALGRLSAAFHRMQEEFEPAQAKAIDEIGGHDAFIRDVPGAFGSIINENPLTPAVARDRINQIVAERRAFIDTLTQLNEKLNAIGVEALELDGSEAEIGFLIPRSMFENHLEKMIKELRNINRVLRAFSELETGSAEPVEVKTISTSDPLFFFGITTPVIIAVGAAVKWALSVWKDVEEIRQIRAQTQKTKTFTEEEIEGFFGSKIKKHVESAIENKLSELLADLNKSGREHEQRADLKFALQYILAAIERGLTVEIRHLPPPSPDEAQEQEGPQPLNRVAALAKELTFPVVSSGTTVLTLPSPPKKRAEEERKEDA